jgi:hypothetical protein
MRGTQILQGDIPRDSDQEMISGKLI